MDPQALDTYRFGVNYTPTRDWWYCWNDFQADEIARDLDGVAAIGADHIRVMLLWPFFQPNAGWVSPVHLAHLDTLMRIAADRGLDVCVAPLNGHLTGQNFIPPFQKNRSFYSDPVMLGAQRLYLERVAEVVRPHPNLLGIDLGNEINCCWFAKDLAEGDAWFLHTLDQVEQLLPGRTHVNGVDNQPWFHPTCFSPSLLARRQPIIALHSWVYFTGALRRGGPLEAPSLHLVDSMAALARAYAGGVTKPVWVQEYGASEEWMDAAIIPEFLERATQNAIDGGVTWFTWWASHDIDRKFEVDPLEYSLGLIGCDRRAKPQAESFRRIAEAYRGKRRDSRATPAPPPPPAVHSMESTWEWMLRYQAGLISP